MLQKQYQVFLALFEKPTLMFKWLQLIPYGELHRKSSTRREVKKNVAVGRLALRCGEGWVGENYKSVTYTAVKVNRYLFNDLRESETEFFLSLQAKFIFTQKFSWIIGNYCSH